MLPPATETGAFAFTAFWSLLETPSAHWSVSAFWTPSWKPPAPPQPAKQPSLPSLPSLPSRPCLPSRPSLPSHPQRLLVPTFWRSDWSWSVLAVFETSVVADEVAVCDAVLGPELTLPPAIATGALPFTAF